MARNSRYFYDQAVDEGLQVTILDAVALKPRKASREPPTGSRFHYGGPNFKNA
jgi:hypothetical protein